MRLSFASIALGDKVMVEMSPFDLSKGVIIEKKTVAV
jgi:translation initiation factor IF-1